MKLVNPTDEELNRAFAEHVAGWIRLPNESTTGCIAWTNPNNPYAQNRVWFDGRQYSCHGAKDGWPNYCTSADAVLPWLEKAGWRGTSNRYGSTCAASVSVLGGKDGWDGTEHLASQDYTHTQTPFPRAAVIALLKAHGVEIEP